MERFFNKIVKCPDTGCWNWSGALRNRKRNSYGSLKYEGKTVDAHRVSWIIHNGSIPEKMFICHTCDNRRCVNPNHLFVGTHSDNMKDAFKKGKICVPTSSQFKKGISPENKRLNLKQSKEVKSKIENRGNKTLKKLSEELNLPYQLLRDINCGRVYK